MLADALLVAGKDLRLELRTRVALGQVLPFSIVVVLLFAFAIDPGRGVLARVAPGLFWVAVLLSALLAVHRSNAAEAGPGVRDALRLSGLEPAALFAGKAAAVAVQLLALEVVLAAAVVVLYDVEVAGVALLAATAVVTTLALAAAGVLYGLLVAGLRMRETLLPLLLLPALAPVLIAATTATDDALAGASGEGWPWAGLLALLAALYAVAGVTSYGILLEEST